MALPSSGRGDQIQQAGTQRVIGRGEIFVFDGSGTAYDDSRSANGNAIPGVLGRLKAFGVWSSRSSRFGARVKPSLAVRFAHVSAGHVRRSNPEGSPAPYGAGRSEGSAFGLFFNKKQQMPRYARHDSRLFSTACWAMSLRLGAKGGTRTPTPCGTRS